MANLIVGIGSTKLIKPLDHFLDGVSGQDILVTCEAHARKKARKPIYVCFARWASENPL